MNIPATLPHIPPSYNQYSYAYAIKCVIFHGRHSANWLGMHRCLRNRLNKLADLRKQCDRYNLDAISAGLAGEIEGIGNVIKTSLNATANSSSENRYTSIRGQIAEELRELDFLSGDSIRLIQLALTELEWQIAMPAPPPVLEIPYYGGA